MREVGFTAVSEDQLVRMRIHCGCDVVPRLEDGFTLQTPGAGRSKPTAVPEKRQ